MAKKTQDEFTSFASIQELADYLGVSRQQVYSYGNSKRGKKRLELMKLGFVCKKNNIDYSDLEKLIIFKRPSKKGENDEQMRERNRED